MPKYSSSGKKIAKNIGIDRTKKNQKIYLKTLLSYKFMLTTADTVENTIKKAACIGIKNLPSDANDMIKNRSRNEI